MNRQENALYRMAGASNHTSDDRAEHDFYATPAYAIDALIKDGGAHLAHYIWEPACGDGSLSKRLEEYGHEVVSTDLVNHGFGQGGIDFLKCVNDWKGDIITNPPYSLAQDFVEHALSLISDGNKVFMFMRLNFLESKRRQTLFNKRCLRCVYVFRSRISCLKNGDINQRQSGVIAYAWYEFEKGIDCDPIIKWIN